ncbi:MAG: Ni/Fe hydrogenase subunit alpha [Candidatus Bathyarchaeota archaeon]|nr:Ni/Fe hydrogenase subunit alpha [Candidatus Bathyarchaeum tardum]WGM90220.1 MAG: Ni/Fe hydrogenase subunit alpha [Candidatus Bathyarchaeum tardum]
MREIVIDPITRLEGHGKITIFLNDDGNVENAYFQVPELRGFEKFCEGRRAEDLPIITTRICGVCPVAHHMAGAKALDAAFNVEPTETAKKLRELEYCGYFIYDHILHFYFLGGPDFVVGPDAPAAKRNILGVIEKAGLEVAGEVIKHRAFGQRITGIIGGRPTHPVSAAMPGGIAKAIDEDERQEIEDMLKSCHEFAKFSLKLFDDVVLKNADYVNLITSDPYNLPTYYMGTVDENNKVNFYDGKVRVVDPEGKEFVKFGPSEYLDIIEERVEPWTYVKMPYLKKVGWNGFTTGPDSGIYRVGPLGRLNASDGMATPVAQAEYERMYKTLGGKPVHATLAFHWARLIELMYATERGLELIKDPEITSKNIRNKPGKPGEGVGIVEAARGTLIHHYQLDENALAKKINLVVATTHNAPGICMSIKNAAQGIIKNGEVNDGLLNKVEMAFRAYDPCWACATHFAIGEMPLQVNVFDSQKKLVKKITR